MDALLHLHQLLFIILCLDRQLTTTFVLVLNPSCNVEDVATKKVVSPFHDIHCKLRFVRNCFPHHGYIWNYGAFPQTWEDPNFIHPDTKAKGDQDPVDVCEIGELVGYVGQVKQVKVLGTVALIDEGETDWKVIVIDVNDPLAHKLNDIEDVERHLPGLLRATNEWFRIYKIPDGKPENNFAFSGEAKNKSTLLMSFMSVMMPGSVWLPLTPCKTDDYNICVANTEVVDSPYKVNADDAQYSALPKSAPKAALSIDSSIDKWFFLSGQPNL
ncbi:hypothetical protein BSLG_005966 [Batrachochytrium salamandrivorans]|nr:hypothetical protein BSLG_005966 [Batrachochytrium salamandrivorans]